MAYDFEGFRDTFPNRVEAQLRGLPLTPDHPISVDAEFGKLWHIGRVRGIGHLASIGDAVIIEDNVTISHSVRVGARTVLMEGVHLSANLMIEDQCFFFGGSSVAPETRATTHNYAREIHRNTIVGPGVVLPSEVQVGPDAIVPTQASIGQIGPFGTSKRMVTVHGSSQGPRYNVGCQQEIDLETFRERIINCDDTVPESAADYHRNLSKIQVLADKTQTAFDKEQLLASELRDATFKYDYLALS